MDLAKKIPYFTLDVISHIGLGHPFGDLLADADLNGYLKASEEGLKIGNTAWALGLNWLRNFPIIGPLIAPSEKDSAGFGKMMAESRRIVDARKAKSTQEKSDMLASFIRNGVHGDDLFQEVFEQILAGSDTTAAAIRGIMLFVMANPRVYGKLQEEIDGAVKDGRVAEGEVISDVEARKLPYLGAVVREGMRVSSSFRSTPPHAYFDSCVNRSTSARTNRDITDPPPCNRPLLPHHPSLRRYRHPPQLLYSNIHPRRHSYRLLRLVYAPHQHRPLRLRRNFLPPRALAHQRP
jgi:cytochrome P450